jgi:UDP-GlcNAc:undecaprenyl-phosphate GlcNAc-1-phosphate transferase
MIRWSNVSKPALGGITFFMSFLVSTACFGILFDHNELFKNGEIISLIGALCLAFIMGLADDAYNTKPWLKFFIQITCGLILIFGSLKTGNNNNIISIFEIDFLNYLITVLWVVGIMNSINMLDNMDGITTVTSIFIFLTALVFLALQNAFQHYDFMIVLGLIGALVSFLFYNWSPSKMYMGDSGSQFLGLLLAFIGIKYFWNSTIFETQELVPSKQIIIVCLIFILPISDTTSVFINRIYRKQSPFIGGKDHTTHHLSFLGFNNSQIIFIFSGIAFLSSIIAIALYRFVNIWTNFKFIMYVIYILAIFITLYISTQQHKDLRK